VPFSVRLTSRGLRRYRLLKRLRRAHRTCPHLWPGPKRIATRTPRSTGRPSPLLYPTLTKNLSINSHRLSQDHRLTLNPRRSRAEQQHTPGSMYHRGSMLPIGSRSVVPSLVAIARLHVCLLALLPILCQTPMAICCLHWSGKTRARALPCFLPHPTRKKATQCRAHAPLRA